MIRKSEILKLIEKIDKKLPDVIYDYSGGDSVLWNHSTQRFDTSKKLLIFSIEREIKILENIRGENISFHTGQNTISIEDKIEDLLQSIKEIKQI